MFTAWKSIKERLQHDKVFRKEHLGSAVLGSKLKPLFYLGFGSRDYKVAKNFGLEHKSKHISRKRMNGSARRSKSENKQHFSRK